MATDTPLTAYLVVDNDNVTQANKQMEPPYVTRKTAAKTWFLHDYAAILSYMGGNLTINDPQNVTIPQCAFVSESIAQVKLSVY